MTDTEAVRAFKAMTHRVIVVPPAYSRLAGSIAAGVMLAQGVYWQERTTSRLLPGYFFKTAKEWTLETTLTDNEQATARKQLRNVVSVIDGLEHHVWDEQRKGIPAKMFYRVDMRALWHAIAALAPIEYPVEVQEGGDGFGWEGNSVPTEANPEALYRVKNHIKRGTSIPQSRNQYTRNVGISTPEKRESITESTQRVQDKDIKARARAASAKSEVQDDEQSVNQRTLVSALEDAGYMPSLTVVEEYNTLIAEKGIALVLSAVRAAALENKAHSVRYVKGIIRRMQEDPADERYQKSQQRAGTTMQSHRKDESQYDERTRQRRAYSWKNGIDPDSIRPNEWEYHCAEFIDPFLPEVQEHGQ